MDFLNTFIRIQAGTVMPSEAELISVIGTMMLTECERNGVHRVKRIEYRGVAGVKEV